MYTIIEFCICTSQHTHIGHSNFFLWLDDCIQKQDSISPKLKSAKLLPSKCRRMKWLVWLQWTRAIQLFSMQLGTMEDGWELQQKRSRIHPHSVCMRSPWPCRLLQLGSPHYYRGWDRPGYYSVCCVSIMNGYGTTVFFVELQLKNDEKTASFLLPFWCHVSMLWAFLKFGSKDGRFLSMQIVSQLFLFSHSAFQSWRLKPR